MKAITVKSAVALWWSVVPDGYARRFYQEFRAVRLDWEFLTCGWFNLPVWSVQHDLEAEQMAFRFYNFSGVGATDQRDCLANGRKRATDCAIFDLVFVITVACADSCHKAGEESDLHWEVGILKVRVHSHRRHILLPVIPKCLPAAGSCLQSSRVKGINVKTEITRVAIAEVGWQTVHEFWFGSLKLQLKKVSKPLSDWWSRLGITLTKPDPWGTKDRTQSQVSVVHVA